VLELNLEARTGVWQPDGPGGPSIRTAAFAEPGRPLQTPGPLVRVAAGTSVHAVVRNSLAVPMWMFGMGGARGFAPDSVEIAPGATHEFRFELPSAGSYYYAARTGPAPIFARSDDDSQLHGAIVVDQPGTRVGPNDRVFVISNWFTLDSSSVSGLGPNPALAFNGLTWPHTERLTAQQGDSLHWRFVNLTPLEHPLHLHGFYFRVDGRGDGVRDTLYGSSEHRLAVTEPLFAGQTIALTWSPERSGNWIFHCHFASHIASVAALEADRRMPVAVAVAAVPSAPVHAVNADESAQHAAMQHRMAGLVLGIRVTPRGRPAEAGGEARPIRLLVRSRPSVYGDYVGYAYVLGGSPAEADPNALPIPGPILELTRGQPVAVTIVNQAHEGAAIHWHGIELQSFPDGVPGWSGQGKQTLPMVAPGESLTVRFTPPRAGTFMYHSHSNEFQQIGSGLYGAIVVREPGAVRDAETDRVLLFSDDGPTINFLKPPPPGLLNGRALTDTLVLAAGVPHRLRLINIRTDYILNLMLQDGDKPLQWKVVAKDGADLPPAHVMTRPATVMMAPGEINDVELPALAAGVLGLKVKLVNFDRETPVVVPVVVR
jgi:manganese oxidase